jgi:hypothetical protein
VDEFFPRGPYLVVRMRESRRNREQVFVIAALNEAVNRLAERFYRKSGAAKARNFFFHCDSQISSFAIWRRRFFSGRRAVKGGDFFEGPNVLRRKARTHATGARKLLLPLPENRR